MSEDRWKTIEILFEKAAALPPDERAAFLQAHCDNPGIREEVASLLAAHDEGPAFLDKMAGAVVAPALAELNEAEHDAGDPLDLIGASVGPYAVEEYLGGGGMGVVYKADDPRLGRSVALKLLPPHLAAHPEAGERFVREARSAAALDHPNISTIHEIGTTDAGRRFIAMTYYGGPSLKEKLARDGALPVDEALAYALQIAEGLRHAHEAGVVHRDVKPGNVMLDTASGSRKNPYPRVKIVDFGLAKMSGHTQLTQANQTLGTAAYMAPEQMRGGPVDHRADLWSLGVLLYEMLAGRRPFSGDYPAALAYAILHDAPAPLTELRDDLPGDVAAIVDRCLEKDPERRYDSAEELLADLRAVRSGTAPARHRPSGIRPAPRTALLRSPAGRLAGIAAAVALALALAWAFWPDADRPAPPDGPRSVAVLPFTYLSAADSTDYFSLGITEEILTRLAQVSDLSVISRTSVMQYRNTEKSLQQIGDELGVSAIVEGSVQLVGDRVRISAQLIDAETDRHLWGESYNREVEDILTVQSEVALRIAEALEARLLPREQAQLTTRQEVDETAYHLYLRAQHLRDLRDPEGMVRATELFREAIGRDSTFAPAYGGLAMASVWTGLISRLDPDVVHVARIPLDTSVEQAMQASRRALALDPSVVEAHLARALVYELHTREWDLSEQAFERALELNPNHSEARREYGWMLLRLGRIDSALAQMKRAVALDPLSWSAHQGLGYAYYCNRQFEEAVQGLETAISLGSRYPLTRKYLGGVLFKYSQQLFREGRTDEARARLQRAEEMFNELWGEDAERRRIFEAAVQGEEAEELRRLDEDRLRNAPYIYALLLLGNTEFTLERYENHAPVNMRSFMDPLYDPLLHHPRYERLVERQLEHEVDIPR